MRKIWVYSLLIIILFTGIAFAQSPAISNGLAWLKSTQSPEGYWGDALEVQYNSFVDTCAVVETMKYLNETGTEYDSAIQWINSTDVFNNDYLFTKMLVLAQAGFDVSTIRDYLLSIRNDDGGWGVTEGFESDIKRTALALQALKAVNYTDFDTISYALGYLTNNQNPDGGFGFYPSTGSGQAPGDESNVYVTAMVSITLQQYSIDIDLANAINGATDYLIDQQQADGGWGSVYETVLAYIALRGEARNQTVLGRAI